MMSKAAETTWLARSNALIVLLGLFSILMCGTLGCRSARDNQIDLLERELRTQEDYIYELEDYVLEYSEKLRHVRSVQPHEIVTQVVPLEPVLVPSKQADKHPVEEPLDQLPEPDETEDFSPDEDFFPEEMEIPELELETSEPVGQLEELRDDSLVEAEFEKDSNSEHELVFVEDSAVELVSAVEETANDAYESEAEFLEQLFDEEPAESGDRYAERLVIVDVFRGDQSEVNSLRTGLTSLLTVIEARDANDEPVDLDGKISLMIMTTDPVSPQRLKRWDFSAEETASAWQSSHLGDGLHLELPLEGAVESEEAMELWVRLVKADGRKLLAQLPLQWEQLISVDDAMDTQQEIEADDDQLADNGARPLQREELAELPSEEVHEIARADKKKNSMAGSRWRKSLQRTHMNTEGYSSTASAAKGWISQPTGGREPLPGPATAVHSATTVRQTAAAPPNKKPVWTAGRNARKNSTQEKRSQWAPPGRRGYIER